MGKIATKRSITRYRKRQQKETSILGRLLQKFGKKMYFIMGVKPEPKKTHKQRRIEKLIRRGLLARKES